ncbi:major urinary protein-like isoform X2 [Macrotis lagotis]|uniref:major urinary protein-like isoform X2 n=1 Tax=Macrotis lagotis TaxID=92651 RepID=UPI003D69FBAE
MKILLLTVGLALVCHLQAQDSSELTGEWFTIALASNVTSKIENGGNLEMFIKTISEHDGILSGVFFKRQNGKCVQFSVTTFTGEGGKMLVQYDGLNDFSIQSVDSNHVIFILNNVKNGEVIIWAELYGRTPDLSDEIKKKFGDICEKFGIRKDQIRDLSNNDRCEELR